MRLQLSEMADRATILFIKKRNGLDVEEELQKCLEECKGMAPELWNELLELNQKEWNLLSEVGDKYREIELINHKRVAVKNKITERYGGYKELKKY